MQRVADLVNSGEYGQALVRLWVLANEDVGSTRRQNIWELQRNAAKFTAQTDGFFDDLVNGRGVTVAAIEAAPFAFVRAVDRALAQLPTSLPFNTAPYTENDARYWVTSAPEHRSKMSFATQASTPEALTEWHTILPARTSAGLEVVVIPAPGAVAEALGTLIHSDTATLRCWLAHFTDTAQPVTETSLAGKLRATSVQPREERHASILSSLQRASASGAHAIVMPEMTVDLEARTLVEDWLVANPGHAFSLVVAGSFHEKTPDGWFNTAHLSNRLGEPILVHRKIRPWGSALGAAEDIYEGRRVTLLQTPIGTMTVLICKDFLDDHPAVSTLLHEVPVDWVFVPSFSDDTTCEAHRRRAERLSRVWPGTSCAFATQRDREPGPETPPLPGFGVQAPAGTCQNVELSGGIVALSLRLRRLSIPHKQPKTVM